MENKSPKKPTGFLLYRGTTNGHAFAAIATGFAKRSDNRKTGDMVQIWFVLENVHPVEAVKTGIDAATICAGCPFASGNGCYVNVGQAPLSVWKGFHRGIYPELAPVDYSKVFGGRAVRFGAYGNPSLLPLSIVKAIAAVSNGWTGYFHDWRSNPLASEYAKFFMASTETASSYELARSLNLRTFHASPIQPAGTIECLSDAKGISCAQCKLCSGLSKSRLPSVWINPHGSKVAKAVAVAATATV